MKPGPFAAALSALLLIACDDSPHPANDPASAQSQAAKGAPVAADEATPIEARRAHAPTANPTGSRPASNAPCADAMACYDAAARAERAGELAAARALHHLACEQGLGQACARLGEMHRDGKGGAPDDARATELFQKACALESQLGCDALGH